MNYVYVTCLRIAAAPMSFRIGIELIIGTMIVIELWNRKIGLVGAFLAFGAPFVTLSFLVTTPEAWVPALGDAQHGFPYLSGAGRLVVKDVALLAGAWLALVVTARELLADAASTEGLWPTQR